MELSFVKVSSADAAYLAQELELSLLQAGVPAQALSLVRVSPEHMGPGPLLGVDVDTILHAIGAAGYIACFVKCIYEVANKHRVTIRISTKEGSVEIPASDVNADVIEKAITELRKTNSKS